MTSKYQISFALSCYILLKLALLCIKIYSYEFYSYFFRIFVLVCIRMYKCVSRMYSYVPYVTRMLPVCYPYVTRMYSCSVLVMAIAAAFLVESALHFSLSANARTQKAI